MFFARCTDSSIVVASTLNARQRRRRRVVPNDCQLHATPASGAMCGTIVVQ
jgi:hypothetical protein